MMHYTNRDTFIVSAPVCMYTDPDSLESIMAGNEAGANGCAVELDMTEDGIVLLCSKGGFRGKDGSFLAANSADFLTVRQFYPRVVTIGQAIELAKSCAAKLCVQVKHAAICPQIKIALRQSDYLDNAYVCGLELPEAAKVARQHPTLHVMGDLPGHPSSVSALIRAAQDTGLFGLRAAPEVLTEALCREAHRSGLFLAATETTDAAELTRLLSLGVNFIETERPDLAYSLLPQADEQLSI